MEEPDAMEANVKVLKRSDVLKARSAEACLMWVIHPA